MPSPTSSPLSDERVREYEQEISSVEGGYGFTDEMAYDLAKIARALLSDRTALTARLEAVERAHEELFAERGRLREALFTISREFQFSADWNSRCDDAMRSALLPLGSESRS